VLTVGRRSVGLLAAAVAVLLGIVLDVTHGHALFDPYLRSSARCPRRPDPPDRPLVG
jgi:hypothetical protein